MRTPALVVPASAVGIVIKSGAPARKPVRFWAYMWAADEDTGLLGSGIIPGQHTFDRTRDLFDADLELRQLERRGHHLLDALGGLERVLDAVAQRDEHAKFIAPGARKNVARSQGEDQPASKGNQ